MWDDRNSICKEIAQRLALELKNPRGAFSNPLGSLSRSVECGCEVCSVVCRMVRDSEQRIGPVAGVGVQERNEDRIEVEFNESGIRVRGLEAFVLADHPIHAIPRSTPISGDTGSEQGFKKVVQWMNNCLTNHKLLCPTLDSMAGHLPTRVLDLGPPQNESGDVKLLQTSTETGYYVCLSHCWGSGTQPLRTTRQPDTFSQHQKMIEFYSLPKTFQEVVSFTRRLSIRYLWIDSLCIIQDDAEDWREQSALMADVYSKALLTIAASGSVGPGVGLFKKARAGDLYLDWGLDNNAKAEGTEDDETTEASETLRGIRIRQRLPHNTSYHPLLTRGWVLQERLLSPRFLHFGAHELIWECMEDTACECRGLGRLWSKSHEQWPGPKNLVSVESLAVVGRSGVINAWQSAVSDYSRLKLSYPQDIFPAVSGIARKVALATDERYVAGLWKSWLVLDLLWRTQDPRLVERPEVWRAPTFSWASVVTKKGLHSTGVSYEFTKVMMKGISPGESSGTGGLMAWGTTEHVEVINTHCTLLSENDELGQINAAFIILRGLLIRATFDVTVDASSVSKGWNIAPNGKPALPSSFLWPDYDYITEGDYQIMPGSTVFCLKLISTQKAKSEDSYLLYLVLRKTEEKSGMNGADEPIGVYERIGLYRDSRGSDTSLEMEVDRDSMWENAVVKIV